MLPVPGDHGWNNDRPVRRRSAAGRSEMNLVPDDKLAFQMRRSLCFAVTGGWTMDLPAMVVVDPSIHNRSSLRPSSVQQTIVERAPVKSALQLVGREKETSYTATCNRGGFHRDRTGLKEFSERSDRHH